MPSAGRSPAAIPPHTLIQVNAMRTKLILFALVLLFNGCGAIDYYFLTSPEDTVQELYENARMAMHPRHEAVDYVLFEIGVNKFSSHKSIDLPQTQLSSAIEYFRQVVDSHPKSPYVEQSLEYIAKCRRLVAEHELYVGDFYFKS
jgi:outer membrane protein assembly factor BamD